MVTRGFTGRQSGSEPSDWIPPGQHLVHNFPVLTVEATFQTPDYPLGQRQLRSYWRKETCQ